MLWEKYLDYVGVLVASTAQIGHDAFWHRMDLPYSLFTHSVNLCLLPTPLKGSDPNGTKLEKRKNGGKTGSDTN